MSTQPAQRQGRPTPCPSPRPWQRLACICLLLLVSMPTASGQLLDDQQYADALIAGGFLGLAQQYCEARIAKATDAEVVAIWHLQLSHCLQQQAWRQQGTNRTQLISHAVTRLTELRGDAPGESVQQSAEASRQRQHAFGATADLLLRLRQLELLLEANRMELIVRQAGTWYRPRGVQMEFAVAAPPPMMADDFYRQGLESVRDSSAALLTQLNQIRGSLDPAGTRMIRDRLRLIAAEAAYLTDLWPLVLDQGADKSRGGTSFQDAESLSLALTRTSNDPEIREAAELLVVQISLHREDWETFQLRSESVLNQQSQSPRADQLQQYRILALMRQGRPADALQLLNNPDSSALLNPQTRHWLVCEALLGMFAQLQTLGKDGASAAVEAELRAQLQQGNAGTLGVWRESLEQVQRRFQRVRQVGNELADVLDSVDQLAAAGNPEQARLMLTQVIQSLPRSTRVGVRAALSLRAGELAVEEGQWVAAQRHLQTATEEFLAVEEMPSAAAADLLKIYVLGQRWASDASPPPSDSAAAVSPLRVDRAEYLEALQQHVTRFSSQPTTRLARTWLVQLQRAEHPLEAAKQLLALAMRDDQESAEQLVEAGNLLLQLALSKEVGSENAELGAAFEKLAAEKISGVAPASSANETNASPATASPSGRIGVLRFQMLMLNLLDQAKVPDGTDTSPPGLTWDVIDDQLHQLTAEIQDSGSERVSYHALRLISAARTRLDSAEVESITSAIEEFTPAERVEAIRWLQRFRELESTFAGSDMVPATSSGPGPLPGDALLGRAVLQLAAGVVGVRTTSENDVAGREDSPANAEMITVHLNLLPAVVRATGATEDSDLLDRMLRTLLEAELSEAQWTELSDALRVSGSRLQANGAATGGPISSQHSAIVQRAWAEILDRSPQGSDRWLEASLQTAAIHAGVGDDTQARRILDVVGVLYPDWGAPDRLRAALELRQQLSTP